MGEALPKSYYSLDEYLKIEETSLERLEFHDGEIFSMAGETIDHGLISNNIGGALREFLRKKGKNYSKPDDLIELKSIDIEIPLTEIYLNWEQKVIVPE